MNERTRQTLLAAFLAGVLSASIGGVWLFAAQRRAEVTALGQRLLAPELGFAIRMPKGWKQRRSDAGRLVYRQPLTGKAAYDSFTRRRSPRRISFIAIRPNASDAEVLEPLIELARFWDNSFHHYLLEWLGPPRLDNFGYERREGVISFLYRNHRGRFRLIRYQQIKARGRVFWCIMAGNTQLTQADNALLQAVASSFELRGQEL